MKHLKKRCFTMTCFLVALLIGSLGPCAATADEPAVPTADILQAYADVLSGNQSYIQCNSFDDVVGEATMADEIDLWYGFGFDPPIRFIAFCVTDLDADGNPELLLKLADDFGYELMRYADGRVYGYPFFARGMEAVTADGEIHGSNGAENFGWYGVSFNADHQLIDVDVCWQYDDLDESILYFIGDTEVSEDEFTALNEELWNKDSLTWTDYTP
jgi:hypothetical protein